MNTADSLHTSAAAVRRYSFGPALLDSGTMTLQVEGQTVAIDRKPLQVLLCLLEQQGRIVTREQLATHCWPGRILSDTVLTKTLGRLRKALGDGDQQIIGTVHGYGYRIAIPVHTETAEKPAQSRRPHEAERRQLTVLSCEITDGGALGEATNSRFFREWMAPCLSAVQQIIKCYDGHIR